MGDVLTSIISRLVNTPPWNINKFDEATRQVEDYYRVTGEIVHDLVIKEHSLQEQVQAVSAQIMHWGRWEAQAKRVWEAVEHNYRIWRDGKSLELSLPEGKPDGWKKPTQAQIDQMVRTDPEYEKWYVAQEKAEEAYNATMAVYEGFKAKKGLMQAAIVKKHENSAPILSV